VIARQGSAKPAPRASVDMAPRATPGPLKRRRCVGAVLIVTGPPLVTRASIPLDKPLTSWGRPRPEGCLRGCFATHQAAERVRDKFSSPLVVGGPEGDVGTSWPPGRFPASSAETVSKGGHAFSR